MSSRFVGSFLFGVCASFGVAVAVGSSGCTAILGNNFTVVEDASVSNDASNGGRDATNGSDAPSGDDAPSGNDAANGGNDAMMMSTTDGSTASDAGVDGAEAGIDCPTPGIVCNGACVDGTSKLNCGTCANACAQTATCTSGVCVCAGNGNGANSCNGECVDLETNAQHCGNCTTACGSGQACVGAHCVCMSNEQLCSNGNCYDTTSDPNHCGSACVDCTTGHGEQTSCTSSACSCPVAKPDLCGATCTDTMTDSMHCGSGCAACSGAKSSCSGGNCVCPAATPTYCSATSSCVDTTSDVNNCGRCGHSCGSNSNATCVNSVCVPYSLGTIEGNGIAADATYIYVAVTDGTANPTGTIIQCPKSTGCPFSNPVTLDTGLTKPTGVALSGGVLYWATQGQNTTSVMPDVGATLKSCTLKTSGTGCTSTPSTLYTGGAGTNQFGAIAVANGAVYAVDRQTVFSPTTTTTGNTWTPHGYVNGLTIAGSNVYMTSSGGVYDASIPFTTSGTALGLYAANYGGNIGGGSSTANTVTYYWIDLFSSSATGQAGLYRIDSPRAGGASTEKVIADELNNPQDIASDGTNVYWGDINGNVYYCPVAGCSTASSPNLLGTGPGMASTSGSNNAIVADGTYVTWTTFSKIMTVAVP